jgi:hypothetical protein
MPSAKTIALPVDADVIKHFYAENLKRNLPMTIAALVAGGPLRMGATGPSLCRSGEWGVKLKTPAPGAMLVFKRKGGGHVSQRAD